jgi:hypothetical protein
MQYIYTVTKVQNIAIKNKDKVINNSKYPLKQKL